MTISTRFAFLRLGPALWLLVLLLGLASLRAAYGQTSTAPFEVNVTPPGPVSLTNTNTSQLLTATVVPGLNGVVLATALQADGKLLVGGYFTTFNGVSCGKIVRLLTNGSLDTNFNPNGVFSDSVKTIVVQPDQKILVGGYFRTFGTAVCGGVVRLNTDGTRDTGFSVSAPMLAGQSYVATIAVQLDGKVVVGGYNFNSNGNTGSTGGLNPSLARYSVAGVLDTGFQPWFRSGAVVTGVALLGNQPQSVVVGGSMLPTSTIGGFGNYTLLVLNSSGGFGTSFTTQFTGEGLYINSSYYAVTALAVANVVNSSGAYIGSNVAVARRHTDNSQFVNNVHYLTLSSTGAAATFSNGIATGVTAPNNAVYALAFQSDGKILLGGSFRLANGSISYLARLNAPAPGATTLTPDATFSASPDARVNALAVQSNAAGVVSTIAIGGNFTTYNGTPSKRFARLSSTGVLDPASVVGATYQWRRNNSDLIGATSATYTAGISGTYTVAVAISGVAGQVVSNPVVVTGRKLTIITSTPAAGTYDTVIVKPGGIGKLTGDITIVDNLVVEAGGILRLGPYHVLPGVAGSKFQLQPGGTLSVGDPLGITTAGPGAVTTSTRIFSPDASYTYTGTTNQTTGNGLPSLVRNLTDSTAASATLTLSTPVTQGQTVAVGETLTMASAGNFILNGQTLTLLSSAAGTALVVDRSAGTGTGGRVVGTAIVQRYISPAPTNPGPGYRYYSPPVSGPTVTVGSLATAGFQPVINSAYNNAPNPRTVTPLPNVFKYNLSRTTTTPTNSLSAVDFGLESPASLGELLEVGKGYAVKLPAKAKISFTGTLNTGPQALTLSRRSTTVPLAANGGWNLVGNPYPAPLDWSLVAANDRTNLDAAIYTYVSTDSTNATAGYYTASVNGWGESPVVATGQSFFVRVSDGQTTGNLNFKNTQRVTSYTPQATFSRPAGGLASGVEVGLSGSQNGGGGGSGKPSVAIYEDSQGAFSGASVTAFSSDTDAYRIPSTNGLSVSIAAAVPEEELAIKAYQTIRSGSGSSVPLTVRVDRGGRYTWRGLKVQPPQGFSAYLYDSQANISHDLSLRPDYFFDLPIGQPATTIVNRFFLRFAPTVLATADAQAATRAIAVFPNPAHQQVSVQIPAVPGAAAVQATLLNELGQVVRRQATALPAAGTSFPMNLLGLAPGVYALHLQLGSATVVRRLVVE